MMTVYERARSSCVSRSLDDRLICVTLSNVTAVHTNDSTKDENVVYNNNAHTRVIYNNVLCAPHNVACL